MRIINRDPEDNGGKHILVLKEASATKERVVHEYRRHVAVAWSPAGKFLTITDYAESTDATCFLYEATSGATIDLAKEAERSNKVIADLMSNEHAYFTCAKWRGPSSILIKIKAWGRNSPSGNEQSFEYTVGHGFQQVRGAAH